MAELVMATTGCKQTIVSKQPEQFGQTASEEKLRRAVDEFRLQPSDANRRSVTRELVALNRQIQLLEDQTQLAGVSTRDRLLSAVKSLRSSRDAALEEFNAPIEQREMVASAPAEEGAETVESSAALPPIENAIPENIPVRRAVPIAQPVVETPVVADEFPAGVPVRRAVAAQSSTSSLQIISRAVIVRSDENHHLTIWQRGEADFPRDLARR